MTLSHLSLLVPLPFDCTLFFCSVLFFLQLSTPVLEISFNAVTENALRNDGVVTLMMIAMTIVTRLAVSVPLVSKVSFLVRTAGVSVRHSNVMPITTAEISPTRVVARRSLVLLAVNPAVTIVCVSVNRGSVMAMMTAAMALMNHPPDVLTQPV